MQMHRHLCCPEASYIVWVGNMTPDCPRYVLIPRYSCEDNQLLTGCFELGP